ncbi:5'-3' exonuclease [Mycoplasmopsis primatum]|uniref:5'-3' exonuclease n=1 Tax=Mycoplasmopsis primatum TaxID=55604 RepID=UPI000496C159|nr:5'-3' exonuclease H3TH domain-containing protein [Mycoplasmopsis primatum]
MASKKNLMLLIDGNFLMFQSFYASYNPYKPEGTLKASNGVTTNGVHVFLQTMFKLMRKFQPSHMFIAFDAKGKTKRHEQYEEYKAGRTKAPVIIFEQFDLIKKILTAMNIKWYEKVGDEADDLIATVATKNCGFKNYIFSKDKDLLQLVNENNSVIKVNKDDNYYQSYSLDTIEDFKDTYDINPSQIPDYKGLAGDSSDNLKGVQGIGPKKATSLLNQFNTLEGIYKNIESIKGKTKEYLINDKESAFFSKKLAILNCDVDMNTNIDDFLIKLNTADAAKILSDYNFTNIYDTYFSYFVPFYDKKSAK